MTTALAVAELFRDGAPVLVGDEDAGSVYVAAAAATIAPGQLARLQQLGRGTVVLAVSRMVAERLQLLTPARSAAPDAELRLTTPISAARSVEGGWSLQDRALAMRVAADPESGPGALTVPGQVLTAQIQPDGRGAAAAALELARLAGLEQVVVLSPVLDEAGSVMPLAAALNEPRLRWLPRASSGDLHTHAAWRSVEDLAVTCELPMRDGRFRAIGYGGPDEQRVTIAFVHGDPARVPDPPVHVHLACQLGDVFGSLQCGCRAELDDAIEAVISAGAGVIVYAQPSHPRFMECPRGRDFARPAVLGLLRAIGVHAAAEQALVPVRPALHSSQGEMEACA